MKLENFNFSLNTKNIAQRPAIRDESRLLFLPLSANKNIEHRLFKDLIDYLNPGDVLVLNNSKVIPTRLWGVLDSGGQREITLVRRIANNAWDILIRPNLDIKKGMGIVFVKGKLRAKLGLSVSSGIWRLFFSLKGKTLDNFLYKYALVNSPFYLRNPPKNLNCYQTVYAKFPGSAQPPTAGLHFTNLILNKIKNKGVKVVYITLHISGSILPVSSTNLNNVQVSREWFSISNNTARIINNARIGNNRIFAVGTTVMRALESAPLKKNKLIPYSGWTDLTILPRYKFKIVKAFLTNFHLPMSSHLLLTSAFGGKRVLVAYKEALKKNYGFLDFGDSMLII